MQGLQERKEPEAKKISERLKRKTKMNEDTLTEDSLHEDSLEMLHKNVMLNDPAVTH